jgi:hypothetical protein
VTVTVVSIPARMMDNAASACVLLRVEFQA